MIVRKNKNEYRVELGKVLSYPYTLDDINSIMEWCKDNFGFSGTGKNNKWRYGWVQGASDYFYFKSEKDALYFVLRWS